MYKYCVCFFTSVDDANRLQNITRAYHVQGMQEMKKLNNAPSPIEPYLSQAQAAVAAARKSLKLSPREVLLHLHSGAIITTSDNS